MKQQQFEFILITGTIITFGVGFGLAWFVYPRFNAGQPPFLVLGTVALLILGLGFALNSFVKAYVYGAIRLSEDTKTIMTANPGHRAELEGPAEMKHLAETINSFADRFQTVLDTQSNQIEQSRASLEAEKNRLAALMSELTEGVLVCNSEGRILLYNNRAQQLLGQVPGDSWENNVGGFVGLGRSIFGLIGRNTLTQALEDLAYRLEKQSSNLVGQFVTSAANGHLIRARIAPTLTQETMDGFVLTLEDVTHQSQRSHRRDILLEALTEGVRSSLANIRTAIETIEQFPEMDSVKLNQLRKIISEEALTLSTRLNEITAQYGADLKADWQLEEMLGSDLLWAVQRRFEDKLSVTTTVEEPDDSLWLKVDSYAVVQAMTYIMHRLNDDYGLDTITLCLRKRGQLATFDLIWENGDIDMDTLWSWQNVPMTTDGTGTALTLREVAERHGGEIWCQADPVAQTAYFRLLFPTTFPKPARSPVIVKGSRPEYYDFDLFRQPGQNAELDAQPLKELTYTVFDTETTGLNPSEGDEIISVSAVRIVNGRLLRQEVFDQLVDPKRALSSSSKRITGISDDMLKGQPTAEQIIPLLHRFTEGTVLVGHNAAFDMRLLQLKEAITGIKFTNPVLDTLFLSVITHPNQTDHSLERIAQRFGLNVTGRHTSLGDAFLTGEIFLKQVALLAEQGITTLGQAREAAEKTYYARLSY